MGQQIFFIEIIWTVRIVTVTKTPHRNIIHEPCLPLQGIDDPAEQTKIPRSAAVPEYQSAGTVTGVLIAALFLLFAVIIILSVGVFLDLMLLPLYLYSRSLHGLQ